MRFRLFLAGGLAAAAVPAPAAPDVARPAQGVLDVITVTAAKRPTPLGNVAGTVSIITDEDIERRLVHDIKDLIRYEPGVSVSDQGSRFGLAGFNIRGIDGNRVAIEIDGIGLSNAFAIGDFSNASQDFVDVDALRRVEIVRGPASSLYGSDALAGVVHFVSKDPGDYIGEARSHVSLRGGYDSDDDAWFSTGTVAGSFERLAGSLVYTHRDGHERDTTGDTPRDPHDYETDNVLAKLVVDDGPLAGLELAAEHHRTASRTVLLSGLGREDRSDLVGFPYIVDTRALDADDARERSRGSVSYDFGDASGGGRAQLYFQRSKTEQDTVELRDTIIFGVPDPVRRDRRFLFEQRLAGAELTLSREWTGGRLEQRLTYGLEIEATRTEQLRDGLETSLTDGSSSKVVGPDEFPVRDFPTSDTLEAGLYLQHELGFGESGLRLVPGLRLDYYRLEPDPDDIFTADNPGVMATELEETHLSPKLGLVYDVTADLTVFAQYARGFRAPPFNDVNIGFTNLQFGYTTIPNPDLEPETSDGFELGLRGERGALWFDVAAFHNSYEEFIESFVALSPDDPQAVPGLLTFQSRNIDSATIYGADAMVGYRPVERYRGLELRAGLAWARGENNATGQPLASVNPPSAVAGASYAPPDRRWSIELVATLAARQDDVDRGDGEPFESPGYVTFDLLGEYRFNPHLRLGWGLFNLTDRQYWHWSDVRGRAADDPALERFLRPGLNGSVTLNVDF